jgi:hypothetical protein
MEERVLIYKDDRAIEEKKAHYFRALRGLKGFCNELKSAGIEPTMELLSQICLRDNWEQVKSELEKAGADVAKVSPSFKAAYDADVMASLNALRNKRQEIIGDAVSGYFNNIDCFTIQNGTVELDPAVLQQIEAEFSYYADSEGRKSVLEAFDVLKKAIDGFNQAVANAPKSEAYSRYMKHSFGFVNPQPLSGLKTPGFVSLGVFGYDGEVSLQGEFFKYVE